MTTTVSEPGPIDGQTDEQTDAAGAVAERIFTEGAGAFHQFSVFLGVRLGLFAGLAARPQSTAAELAAHAGVDERYTLEWLQAEVLASLVVADSDDFPSARFRLADGVAEALVDEVNPAYVGGVPLAVGAVGTALRQLVGAYRSGAGLAMDAYGPELVEAQAAFNRPLFVNELTQSLLPQIPDVYERLRDAARPARIAEIGCGAGWASIELAKAFPHISVDGYDNDAASLETARRNAAEHGVGDRVRFHRVDASSTPYGVRQYDAIFFFECVHDLGRPVEALAMARSAVTEDGAVIVMDERTGDKPQVGDPVEAFFAAVSVSWCLPQSRIVPDCEAPGTVMRPAVLAALARRAGWSDAEVLPIEHAFFRFYRLSS